MFFKGQIGAKNNRWRLRAKLDLSDDVQLCIYMQIRCSETDNFSERFTPNSLGDQLAD